MIRYLIFITLTAIIYTNISTADEIDDLLQKALNTKNTEVGGDSSARQRYLYEILQKDPDHLEALWQMFLIKMNTLINSRLNEKAPYLAALGPDVNKVLEVAESKREKAFYHYVMAVYASEHKAFDIALSEIEKSIKLEPDSARYLFNKGHMLINKGSWSRSEEEIEQGLEIIEQAHNLSTKNPNPFHTPWHYNFQQALGNTYFLYERWEQVILNYKKSIEIMENANATKSSSYAFAWSNMSKAYRETGKCTKALTAAENALKVMNFGAAKRSKHSAELCIEMQQIVDGTVINTI